MIAKVQTTADLAVGLLVRTADGSAARLMGAVFGGGSTNATSATSAPLRRWRKVIDVSELVEEDDSG